MRCNTYVLKRIISTHSSIVHSRIHLLLNSKCYYCKSPFNVHRSTYNSFLKGPLKAVVWIFCHLTTISTYEARADPGIFFWKRRGGGGFHTLKCNPIFPGQGVRLYYLHVTVNVKMSRFQKEFASYKKSFLLYDSLQNLSLPFININSYFIRYRTIELRCSQVSFLMIRLTVVKSPTDLFPDLFTKKVCIHVECNFWKGRYSASL